MAVELAYIDRPGAVPAAYTLPPSLSMVLESVSATFDGTGAGGAFLACLAVYSQDGKLIGRFPAPQQLAAGDSAEVSFAPLGGDDSNAIHFGRNFGDFLFITTDGVFGIQLEADGSGPISLKSAHQVVTQGPFLAEPVSVAAAMSFNVRLGDIGTGSAFTVNHVGTGNPLIECTVDDQSTTFNLADGSAAVTIKNLFGLILQVVGDSTFQHTLQSGAAQFLVTDSAFAPILTVNGDTSVSINGDRIYLQFTNAAQSLTVANSSGTNVFRIDDDGSLHGLTGQSLTFDL